MEKEQGTITSPDHGRGPCAGPGLDGRWRDMGCIRDRSVLPQGPGAGQAREHARMRDPAIIATTRSAITVAGPWGSPRSA